MGTSEEAADGADDFIDLDDAGDGKLLVFEIGLVDGDEEEGAGLGASAQDLDGADGVEHESVDLAVLDVVDTALAQGYDVAMAYLGLHGVARDVAPHGGLLEAGSDDAESRGGCLVVEDLAEAADEVNVEVRHALGGVGHDTWTLGDIGLQR